jgi:hypothetical protein
MIVQRSILLAVCWFVLSAAAGAGAAAESCDPAAIVAAYRQAEAAYQAKDFAAAAAQFRPLAEQGLGPAQKRLGEILQTGDKPDLLQAYHWIALAADVHAPGAAAALFKVRERIGPAQIGMDSFTTTLWRPGPVWACLAADPHVTRPDGTHDYDFDRVINHGPVPVPTTVQAHRDWLAASLETIRIKSPRYLIYLRALAGIGFIDGPGPFVVPSQRDALPFVMVNQSYMGRVSAKEPAQLLTAVTSSVHAVLVPQAFIDARTRTQVTETYKGYTIRTFSDEDGQSFLRFAKLAIDLTDRLPPDLLKLARAMTDIRYEPHVPGDGRAVARTFGTFVRDPKTGQGYVSFGDNQLQRGPAWMVVVLAGGGAYLRRGGTGQMPGGPDPKRGDCEMDGIEFRTRQVLGLDIMHSRQGC